jgi:hypothetical protein
VRPAAAPPATVANALHFSKQGSLVPTRGATTPVYVMGRLRTMSTRHAPAMQPRPRGTGQGAGVPLRSKFPSVRDSA